MLLSLAMVVAGVVAVKEQSWGRTEVEYVVVIEDGR
jgi:hypothetical protein